MSPVRSCISRFVFLLGAGIACGGAGKCVSAPSMACFKAFQDSPNGIEAMTRINHWGPSPAQHQFSVSTQRQREGVHAFGLSLLLTPGVLSFQRMVWRRGKVRSGAEAGTRALTDDVAQHRARWWANGG